MGNWAGADIRQIWEQRRIASRVGEELRVLGPGVKYWGLLGCGGPERPKYTVEYSIVRHRPVRSLSFPFQGTPIL